jgi:hypothetical protein
VLTPRIRAALIVLAASAGLSACTSFGPYGGIGVGVGSGYGSYGYDPYYSGYGYGSPYGYYSGYGSAYGYDPFGWYNGFYYPGTGYWVYDPGHNRRELTPEERAYWNARIEQYVRNKRGLNGTSSAAATKENWSGFNKPQTVTGGSTATTGVTGREAIRQRIFERQQQARVERQQVQSERQQTRSERFEARQQAISERQEAREQSADDGDQPRAAHRRPR